jgi:creatinine amidohydrolase
MISLFRHGSSSQASTLAIKVINGGSALNLAEMTSPEVGKLSREILVLIPVGSLEQHGQHLPVFTDTLLVDAVATRVEAALSNRVLRLPTQWMGASAHHLAYPGTLTSHLDTHIRILIETAEGLLKHGFRKFFILNGHSGNIDTLRIANRQLKIDWPEGTFAGASYWELAGREMAAILKGPRKEIGHSCEVETSLLLALHPETVRTDLLRDDPLHQPDAVRGASIAFNFDDVTESGQIGYATQASAETGHALMDAIVRRTIETVEAVHAGNLFLRS